MWAAAVDVASDRGLRRVCERAGLDWAPCHDALHDPALAARVRADTDALAALDHWGVPVLVVDGELFWGQDRLDEVERALTSARDQRP
jgi:2-hydroxychromene-2-carboxylate isomerase